MRRYLLIFSSYLLFWLPSDLTTYPNELLFLWRDFSDPLLTIFWSFWRNLEAFWVHCPVSFLRLFNFGSVFASLFSVCHIYSPMVFNFRITIFYFQRTFIISQVSSKARVLPSTTNRVLFYSLHCYSPLLIVLGYLHYYELHRFSSLWCSCSISPLLLLMKAFWHVSWSVWAVLFWGCLCSAPSLAL